MADDVLINKAASIERCVARVEEYENDPATCSKNTKAPSGVLPGGAFFRQASALLTAAGSSS